jgi:hypothetical protein
MSEPIRRSEIEAKARAYLERARDSSACADRKHARVTPSQFEKIVQKEVALTIRQLRGVDRDVIE